MDREQAKKKKRQDKLEKHKKHLEANSMANSALKVERHKLGKIHLAIALTLAIMMALFIIYRSSIG